MEVNGGDAINARAIAQPRGGGDHVVDISDELQDSSQHTQNNYMNNMTSRRIYQRFCNFITMMVTRTLLDSGQPSFFGEQQDSSQHTQNYYMNNITSSRIYQLVNNFIRIMGMTALAITECIPSLEGLDKAARVFEKLVLVWGKAVVLSGFVVTLEMNDFEFIALMCLFIFMRISCRSHMPEFSKVMHLVFAMICVLPVVFSVMQLVSQNFGETEENYKVTRNLALNAFYVMALTNALVNIVYHALNVVLY